jgi:Flp pilus assembly pilin Flp
MVASILYTKLAALREREEGQALLEYALILALVATVCATALTPVGTGVSSLITSAADAF